MSEKQIEALRAEAGTAGDQKMVAVCTRALNGSKRALAIVARALRAAAAMED